MKFLHVVWGGAMVFIWKTNFIANLGFWPSQAILNHFIWMFSSYIGKNAETHLMYRKSNVNDMYERNHIIFLVFHYFMWHKNKITY